MKSFFFSFLFAMLLIFVSSGCRQRDIRSTTIIVPQATNETTRTAIKSALINDMLEGIQYDSIQFSSNTTPASITLKYDSMKLGIKNIEHAIMNAGFDANDFIAK